MLADYFVPKNVITRVSRLIKTIPKNSSLPLYGVRFPRESESKSPSALAFLLLGKNIKRFVNVNALLLHLPIRTCGLGRESSFMRPALKSDSNP